MNIQGIDKILLNRKIKKYKARQEGRDTKLNHASSVGWVEDCKRHLVLCRLKPELRAPTDEDSILRFEEGHTQEKIMRQDFIDANVPIEEAGPMILKELELEGQADDLIPVNGNKAWVDYKTCSSPMFSHVEKRQKASELLGSKHIWIRHYYPQGIVYNRLYGSEWGMLHFKDKDRGREKSLIVPADPDYLDRIATGLLEINEMVRKGEIPDPVYTDACKYCDFFSSCFEDTDMTRENIQRINDADVEAALLERDQLYPMAKKFDKLDKEIKDQFRGQNIVIGDFLLKSTEYEAKVFKVPDEIKKQYESLHTRIRMNIKNLAKPL